MSAVDDFEDEGEEDEGKVENDPSHIKLWREKLKATLKKQHETYDKEFFGMRNAKLVLANQQMLEKQSKEDFDETRHETVANWLAIQAKARDDNLKRLDHDLHDEYIAGHDEIDRKAAEEYDRYGLPKVSDTMRPRAPVSLNRPQTSDKMVDDDERPRVRDIYRSMRTEPQVPSNPQSSGMMVDDDDDYLVLPESQPASQSHARKGHKHGKAKHKMHAKKD